MSDSCAHEFLDVANDVDRAAEGWWHLTVSVRCNSCQALFSFRGLNSGQPNPDEPVVSADGFELRAPIAPGPGAVVGLLVAVGLEGELVPPEQLQKPPVPAGQ